MKRNSLLKILSILFLLIIIFTFIQNSYVTNASETFDSGKTISMGKQWLETRARWCK